MATGGVLSLETHGDNAQMTEDEIKAIVETANDYMAVAAHAHGAEGIRRAIEAGVSSIELGTYLTDDLMAMMKKKGIYYVPTFSPASPWPNTPTRATSCPPSCAPRRGASGRRSGRRSRAHTRSGSRSRSERTRAWSHHGDKRANSN